MLTDEFQPHLFTGRWIGETQGYAMPAHIWEITQQGKGLLISTRWEGQSSVTSFTATLVSKERTFVVGKKHSKAILIDKQHFVVSGWCTNDARQGIGPNYDVLFSRPGIAELTGRQAYTQYFERFVGEGN